MEASVHDEHDELGKERCCGRSTLPHLPGVDLTFVPAFIDRARADRLYAQLQQSFVGRQEVITMFGRTHRVPRLQAWHGDPGTAYRYSGLTLTPEPWTAPLIELREMVERQVGLAFNSVLLNLYRDGRDSVSWHSDDERSLGPEPVIASVSLGATRRFDLAHRSDPNHALSYDLPSGSLLVMSGPTQRCWRHRVPKQRSSTGPRINLTFRRVHIV